MKKRNYASEDVKKLQGSLKIEYTLAKRGATKLRELLATEPFVPTLGAYNGQQAVQHAKAGLKAIYLSGWQVAAAANTSGRVYPDQSLYPVNSVPEVVKEINNALRRADQIQTLEGEGNQDFYLPIIADCEAGFGGALNAYELTLSCIEAGAAAVHFEDQLSSEKKCGHLGGKVLIPTKQAIRNLNAARLAADVCEVDTVILARTDAESGTLITSDIDPVDRPFVDYTKERTEEGFYHFKNGLGACIARGLAYAEYADLLWFETSTPDLDQARAFAEAIHEKFPGQQLAYNCSPSFNWRKYLTEEQCESFQAEIGAMGYKYQFITLAGFHCNNLATFEMAEAYKKTGMRGYSEMQQREFAAQERGFTTVKHQREAGVPYFDAIATAVGATSTTALEHSTEADQF
ncbi:AceA Isocitrate lyase [uncultured Caudovirales phage]|uniref:isocitrate lyase n=1 Tax=uncultured Caudovirales phage TaxID=2100421 RepID=A0A6J5L7M1_9CAUD|nr:AceA Isocitrate lyase [uncultured Caudovirales phage]